MTVLERADIATLPEPFARWFSSRGWVPRAHQLELLAKARAGRSVLLIAPTGAGKTLAGFLPSLVELSTTSPLARSAPLPSEPGLARVPHHIEQVGNPQAPPNPIADTNVASRRLVSTGRDLRREGGLHTLYISPLKALAVDVARNLEQPVAEMGLPIRIETRTGDTPASKRQRQRRDPPAHSADDAGAACADPGDAPTRRSCSARCDASCSTNCTRW